jgi:uncharacterized membrane protein
MWLISVWLPWRGRGTVPKDDVAERALGSSIILAQLNGIVTGTSIIIVGIGAFAVLVKQANGVQIYDAFYAALWAVVALGIALYTMSTLPTRALSRNFVRDKWVSIFCAMSLFFSLAAGVRFLLAVKAILFATGATTFVGGC